MTPLTQADVERFAKLRIPPELLERAGVRRVTDHEAREEYGIRGSGDMAGISFPYYDPLTMANGRRRHYVRIRRDHPEFEDGRVIKKYVAPYGDRKHLYFPPTPEIFADVSVPVALVEAEKSVLALTAWCERTGRKLLPLALGGCWGWRGQTGTKETATGERVPETGAIRDLNICRDGRKTYVLLDANCATNPKVQQARAALVRQLRKQGADVAILDLPANDGINGPDDYIGVTGDEAMTQLFDAAADHHRCTAAPGVWAEADLAFEFTAVSRDLRYVDDWKSWMRYQEGRWQKDRIRIAFDRALNVCLDACASLDAKDTATLKRLKSAQTRAAIENLARSDPRHAATVEQWDKDLFLLNTTGGTSELRTGEPREHRAEDYLTKSTRVSPQPGESLLWHWFLDRITGGDVELQRYLQRVAGYCLTGVTTEHVLFFLYGTGANGKTTYTNTLLGIWGDYAQVAQMETFTENKNDRHPTELAALRGARLVVASETEVGKRWAESRIKALTGGEPIRAHFMRCDDFEFIPQFKLMIQGNHKPGLRSVDVAIRRRVQLIPFTVTIPAEERDPKLGEKLREEWPQILQWAIDGCLAWQREGLNPPSAVRDATEEYFRAEDALLSWLNERVIVSPQAGTTRTSVLYRDYKEWAERTGEFCGSQKRFSQDLTDRGFEIRQSHGMVIDGVSLRPKDEA